MRLIVAELRQRGACATLHMTQHYESGYWYENAGDVMTREALDRLLKQVTDEELETLRDAILREEGRRRSNFHLVVNAPYPPLVRDDQAATTVERWSRLLAWLAKDTEFPPASGKRGVSICIVHTGSPPDTQDASIILQMALVQAGLLVGRTPEWVDATQTQLAEGPEDRIHIEMWEKPVAESL